MSTEDDPCEQELEELKTDYQRLEEENEYLRQSADAFGQLAERLNNELREERRNGQPDRRSAQRFHPEGNPIRDRRGSNPSAG